MGFFDNAQGVTDVTGSNGNFVAGGTTNITADEFNDAVASGSATYDISNIGNEDTGSLGLAKDIGEYTASMNIILDDESHNDHPHLDTIQFINAKMYNINNFVTQNAVKLLRVSRSIQEVSRLALYSKPPFLDGKHEHPSFPHGMVETRMPLKFVAGMTGSLSGSVLGNVTGNADTATRAALATSATTLATSRRIGGVLFNGSGDITPLNHMGSSTYIRLLPSDFGISSYPDAAAGAFYTGSATLDTDNNFGLKPVNQDLDDIQTFTTTFQLPIGSFFGNVQIYSNHGKTVCYFTRRDMARFGGWARTNVLRNNKTVQGATDWPATHVNSPIGQVNAVYVPFGVKAHETGATTIYEVKVQLAAPSHTLQQIVVGYTY